MTKRKIEDIRLATVIYAFLAVIAAYILIIAVMLYGFGVDNWLVKKTVQYVPFPAAIIGGTRVVTVDEVLDNLQAVRQFYENQDFSDVGMRVDFKTEDGQKRLKIKEKEILNKLIENEIIEKLAADRDIRISKEMINQNVDREAAQYDNASDVEGRLNSLYGWNINDFKEKIVKPDMYKDELEKNMKAVDGDIAKARVAITQAQEALKNKENFAGVAKKYSEGESSKNGGNLGWFTADQMIPEIAVSTFILDKGAQSDIIESSLGFHIIKVDDKKTEDGIDKVKISQIFIKTKNFQDWLAEQEKDISVLVLLKGHIWDKESATVDFKGASMKDFENNLDKNSAGDISVLF